MKVQESATNQSDNLEEISLMHGNHMVDYIQELAAANTEIDNQKKNPIIAPGFLGFATMVIWGKVFTNPYLNLPSGAKLKFDGTFWGFAISAGIVAAVGTFFVSNEDELNGDVDFVFTVAGGIVTLQCSRNNRYLGVIVATGLAIGAGAGGGRGKFSVIK